MHDLVNNNITNHNLYDKLYKIMRRGGFTRVLRFARQGRRRGRSPVSIIYTVLYFNLKIHIVTRPCDEVINP